MKKTIYLLLILITGYMSSCSDIQEDSPIPGTTNEEVLIYTNIPVPEVKTKADTIAFDKSFDLYLTQQMKTEASATTTKLEAKYKVGKPHQTGLFWDDRDGIDASLNLLGIYPMNTNFAVGTLNTDVPWEIKQNQNTNNGYEASDLLVSKPLTYTLAEQKKQTPLLFHHVLSKISFYLIPGEGFLDGDGKMTSEFDPAVTIKNIETKADVKASDRDVTMQPDNKKNITPNHLGEVTDEGKTAIFATAIGIPGQSFASGDTIATIKISDNIYAVKLNNALTFAQGKNHIFKVTVRKTDVGLQTTIKEWDDVELGPFDIKIGLESTTKLNGTGPATGGRLFVHADPTQNLISLKGEYKFTGNDWEAKKKIFWDDVKYSTTLKSKAILYNIDTGDNAYTSINENPENIFQGESQVLKVANDTLRFKEMIHPFSRVNITIKSDDSKPDFVDIKKTTGISLVGQKAFDNVNTDNTSSDFLKINYKANADLTGLDLTENGKVNVTDNIHSYSTTLYISPGKIAANNNGNTKMLVVTVKETDTITNEYILYAPKAGITFSENKEYNIVATLSKTDVALNVTIKEWVPGTTIPPGEAEIKE